MKKYVPVVMIIFAVMFIGSLTFIIITNSDNQDKNVTSKNAETMEENSKEILATEDEVRELLITFRGNYEKAEEAVYTLNDKKFVLTEELISIDDIPWTPEGLVFNPKTKFTRNGEFIEMKAVIDGENYSAKIGEKYLRISGDGETNIYEVTK